MASKRRLRRRACEGKVRHDIESGAAAHKQRLGFPFVYYKCQFCSGWHVGRPDKRKRQSLRAKNK